MTESVADILKELTSRLAAVATEFGERADRLGAQPRTPTVDQADLAEIAQRLLDERRARSRFLPAELFHEPAWDMLLALFVAAHAHQVMNVGALVTFAEAPVTTSQRWIEHLYRMKMVTRIGDPVDRRRVEIALSEEGHAAVAAYLQQIKG